MSEYKNRGSVLIQRSLSIGLYCASANIALIGIIRAMSHESFTYAVPYYMAGLIFFGFARYFSKLVSHKSVSNNESNTNLEVDKKMFELVPDIFTKKYRSRLPELYTLEINEFEDLSLEHAFRLQYSIDLKPLLKRNFPMLRVKFESLFKEFNLSHFKITGETNRGFSTPEERSIFINNMKDILNLAAMDTSYTILSSYGEHATDVVLGYLEVPEIIRKIEKPAYKLIHNIVENEDGTYMYNCSIENLNEILLQRFLIKGMDYYIHNSFPSLRKEDGIIDTKSSDYSFDNIFELYMTIHNVNIAIDEFVEKESVVMQKYLKEQVSRTVRSNRSIEELPDTDTLGKQRIKEQ